MRRWIPRCRQRSLDRDPIETSASAEQVAGFDFAIHADVAIDEMLIEGH